jgi:hypothetical protein
MAVDDDLAALYHQIDQVSKTMQHALNMLHLTEISMQMHGQTMHTLQQLQTQYNALVLDVKALLDKSSGSLLHRDANHHPVCCGSLISHSLKNRCPNVGRAKARSHLLQQHQHLHHCACLPPPHCVPAAYKYVSSHVQLITVFSENLDTCHVFFPLRNNNNDN